MSEAGADVAQPKKARSTLPSSQLLEGVRPFDKKRFPMEIVAGITLACLAIPEVMGYTSIAGMPVITGLYTIVLPVILFALLGSSRHLVVGADSASAAIMFAGLAGLATVASPTYVALAGMTALMVGAFLLLARILRLGFLADFLSRTVLIGFLTGVGIQVACGQFPGLFGIPKSGSGPIQQVVNTFKDWGKVSWSTFAVSGGGHRHHRAGRPAREKGPVGAHRRDRGDRRKLCVRPERPRRHDAGHGAQRSAQLRLAGHPVGRLRQAAGHRRLHLRRRARAERGDVARLRRQVQRRLRREHRSHRTERRQRRRRAHRHLRGQRQPDQDRHGGQRRRSLFSWRSSTMARSRHHRAALPHGAARLHAERSPRRRGLPHRRRTRRREGHALASCASGRWSSSSR